MKYAILIFAVLASTANADTYVQGYTKQDGTYVQPHFRSNQDSTNLNNYSTQGNQNPYTGNYGTVEPNYGYQAPQINYGTEQQHYRKHGAY